MNILLSAFACSAAMGSEPGVAWQWLRVLDRQHRVTVLAHACFRAENEAALKSAGMHTVEFIYYEPAWLKGRFTYDRIINSRLCYLAWQIGAYFAARRLVRTRDFDVVHHLTWGTFRYPSLMGWLGLPFVFGPVGGGERAPARLFRSLPFKARLWEWMRLGVLHSGRWDPAVWQCLARAAVILCKTDETLDTLPRWARRKALVRHEIGAPEVPPRGEAGREQKTGSAIRLLFAGRLIGWKGVHFAVRAVALLAGQGREVTLDIMGKGPMEPYLARLARELNVGDRVRFHGHIAREQLLRIYDSSDLFVFPSLHDSSGNVVLESLARGLPVVCLDLGGPRYFVDESCGRVVAVADRDEAGIVRGLAEAIAGVMQDPRTLGELRTGARARAARFSWARQVELSINCFGGALRQPANATPLGDRETHGG